MQLKKKTTAIPIIFRLILYEAIICLSVTWKTNRKLFLIYFILLRYSSDIFFILENFLKSSLLVFLWSNKNAFFIIKKVKNCLPISLVFDLYYSFLRFSLKILIKKRTLELFSFLTICNIYQHKSMLLNFCILFRFLSKQFFIWFLFIHPKIWHRPLKMHFCINNAKNHIF